LGQAALLADKFVKATDWVERNLRPGDTVIQNQSQADLVSNMSGQNVKPGEIMHHDWLTNQWTRPDPTNPSNPANFSPGTAPPVFWVPPPKRVPHPDAEGIDWGADPKTRQKEIDDAWKAEGARERAPAAAAEHDRGIQVQVKVNIESAMIAAEKVADAVRAAVHQAMRKNAANQTAAKSSSAIGGQ
jgi:hypothetical protein